MSTSGSSREFSDAFRAELVELLRWRRDVRSFLPDPLDASVVERLVGMAQLSPSVGFSQPWRFVLVEDATRRRAIRDEFERANAEGLGGYDGDRARLYASLKLSGLEVAPVLLAVFCDRATPTGHGLGRRTMPATLPYSVVLAVHTLWLAARAEGVGVGWVSIVEPERVGSILDVPREWELIALLCVGRAREDATTPELARRGWESADPAAAILHRR